MFKMMVNLANLCCQAKLSMLGMDSIILGHGQNTQIFHATANTVGSLETQLATIHKEQGVEL